MIGILFFPGTSQAVPSPDLLVGIGTMLVQWISIGLVVVLGVFGTMHRFLQILFTHSKVRFLILTIGIPLTLIALVSLLALGYQKYQGKSLMAELQQQDALFRSEGLESDKLVFSDEQVVADTDGKFSSKIGTDTDQAAEIIERYYEHLANGRLKEAYDLSHHKVSRATFEQWYGDVSSISLDKLTVVDTGVYSLELILCEADQTCGRYGVLMTLTKKDGAYTSIADSTVRSLKMDEERQERIQKSNIVVSNAELQALMDNGKIADVVVLDAREDIEYENGKFPNSTHIRIADLKAGRWIDLDQGKTVIVFCWSGIRGKEVAEFLRSKEIDARYVEDGAQGWAESGGLWEGGISIKQTYGGRQYSRVLSCDEMRDEMHDGTFVVDSREPGRYARSHISGSVSIPMLYTPSSGLESAFSEVPQGAKVVTVCDGYVNCFDARVTGIELEKRGHVFLGRFTQLGCIH
ncbi:MAG: rhodanese-like domain-containing protein [Candidatus Moraniibacteriota bacterium]